jgi:hypothetical protein
MEDRCMNKLLFCGIAMLLLSAFAPDEALGQKNAKRVDILDATPEQYALLATYKEMVGTIRSTTSSSIVLRVEYTHPQANSGTGTANGGANVNGKRTTNQTAQLQKQLVKLQRDQVALQSSKTPAQAQQRLVQLIRDQQRLEIQIYRLQVQQVQQAQQQNIQAMRAKGKLDKDYIDFELPLVDKAAIRRLSLGVEYDDKGNMKEPNLAKGAGGLPGFAAKLEDLSNGAPVKVYLTPPKSTAGVPKKKDENGAILGLPANRPQVRMIVMLSEANAAAPNLKKKQ